MTYKFNKKHTTVILIGSLLVLFNLFMVIWYVLPIGPDQWNKEIIPGKIVLVSENTLITRDPRGNIKTFILTPKTQILAGKKLATPALLIPGKLVLVERDSSTSTATVAKEIRVITDKREKKSQK